MEIDLIFFMPFLLKGLWCSDNIPFIVLEKRKWALQKCS